MCRWGTLCDSCPPSPVSSEDRRVSEDERAARPPSQDLLREQVGQHHHSKIPRRGYLLATERISVQSSVPTTRRCVISSKISPHGESISGEYGRGTPSERVPLATGRVGLPDAPATRKPDSCASRRIPSPTKRDLPPCGSDSRARSDADFEQRSLKSAHSKQSTSI